MNIVEAEAKILEHLKSIYDIETKINPGANSVSLQINMINGMFNVHGCCFICDDDVDDIISCHNFDGCIIVF